jgi:hypothetical protein
MYTRGVGHAQPSRIDPRSQIIVKLKTTRQARRVLKDASTGGARPAARSPLDRCLRSKHLQSIEPIFGNAPSRRVEAFRRMAVAAESESDPKLAGLNALSMTSARHAKKTCEDLCSDPLVERAYIPPAKYVLARKQFNSNDPLINRQWGLRAINLFQAEQTARYPDARCIVIAVIDSGIDSTHPDLDGIVGEELSFTTGADKDTSGHGTHVSGIIAAVRNNSRGIRGICNSVNIMSLKALDPYSAVGYYQALRYATDNGARVINMSLGGGHDPTEESLILRAIENDVVVVAAMGNEQQEGNPTSYPAAVKGVISVGASTETDRIAPFSNTGKHIDLVAPGVNILSTVPTYPTALASSVDYEAWPGTSMASPHVAAAAAILRAKRPGATVDDVRTALHEGADEVPGQHGFDTTFGHGRLNLENSLKLI